MGSPLMLNSETVPSTRSLTDLTGRHETRVINIRDCRSGLGIKIAGGRSSLGTDFGIFVKKVLTGGAADIDGGLREGDLLLEVNGCSLVGISNDKAMSVLRNAAQSNEAKLLVSRDSQAREQFCKLMTALSGEVSSLPSSFMNSLPMSSLTRTSSFGSSSSRASTPSPTLGKRSWVMNEGRMSPLAGGRHGSPILLPTNSIDRPSASLQRMYSMDLPTVPVGPTVVQHTPGAHEPPSYNSTLQKLSTPSTGTMYPPRRNGLAHSMERSPNYMYNSSQLTVEQQSVSSEVTSDSGLPTDRHSTSSSPAFDHPTGELQSIQVTHSRGLGLCIVGGTNRTEGPHIYVDDIIEGGDAHKDGRLKRGDRLMFVNGETLVGVTHEQAKSLLTRLKLRSQDAEITYIRGGLRPDNPIANVVFNSAQSSPRESLENEIHDASSQDLQLNLNGIDNTSSRPSSSRSSQRSEADLSNTEIFMKELLAGPSTDSATVNGNSSQASFGNYHSSSQPMISPPVISDTQPAVIRPVISQQVQAVQSPINPGGIPSSHLPMSSGNPQLPPAAIPLRTFTGFQPAMSSTPTVNGTVANGIPLHGHGAPSFNHVYLNGRGISQLHDNTALLFNGNGASPVHISPVQTTFEHSSVPYYLQQDLAALQRVANQNPVPGVTVSQHSNPNPSTSQQSLLTTLSVGGPKDRRNARGSRRLSLDPHTRLRVEKLEVALRYLGFKPTEEQQFELRQRLPSDSNGFVSYGDFVNAARDVFALELNDHSLNNSAVQFAVQDLNSLPDRESFVQMQQQSQQLASLEAIAKQSAEDVEKIRVERDEALREVQHLKMLLKKKEESCMATEEELVKAKREAKGLLAESRSLEKRVHLASEAQKAAKDVEQDYAEVIRLLEKELDAYKAKEADPKPDVKELQELQKRLVVLGCQLRKAEVSKRTYEVATEKLIHFVEMVHECLTEGATERSQQRGKGESVRRESGLNPKPPTYLSRHAKYSPTSLAKEARDTVKSVKVIIEEEPLPFGWEEAYTTDGVRYYINHVTQQTSWLHPVSQVQHLPPIVENEEKVRETST